MATKPKQQNVRPSLPLPGEFSLIRDIAAQFKISPDVTGIGDDCAVIPIDDQRSFLVTTDTLVEDIHFLRDKISAYDLGWKTLAVNLSDIAAMGARPLYAFLNWSLPRDVLSDWCDDFIQGFHAHNVMLLGGDTTRSPEKIMLSVTVIGEAHPDQIKYRQAAQVNDVIAVTGFLGNSSAGLKIIQNNIPSYDDLIAAHNMPRAHLAEGQFLAQYDAVHAMMDVSDGLSSDLQRLQEQSGFGAEIQLEHLPLSESFIKACDAFGWDKYALAASGGEDYCLVTTIAPQQFDAIARAFQQKFDRPLHPVGRIVNAPDVIFTHYQKQIDIQAGYDHFRE